MPAIIRLARHGKKGQPFYHIVVADKRFARDARFVEKIGTYNPRTNPVTIELKIDRALEWIERGAKPSDTARSILSRKGIMLKAHLQRGVKKGKLTKEQADAKFTQWVSETEAKTSGVKSNTESVKREAYKKRMAAEAAARESRNAKRKAKTEAAPAAEETSAPAAEGEAPSA